jgi:hypothetical protein
MPYLLLAIGLLIGLYALYRFFLNADVRQIKALFLAALLAVLCVALFYMALTGRLAAALALMVAAAPIMLGIFKEWKAYKQQSQPETAVNTREEALKILGLKDSADEKDIQSAYKRLMQKIHPDHEGSEWMAAKLNQARDLLLKKKS